MLAVTPPYFDYNWTVRPGLDAALTKKLTDAFLKLDPAKPGEKEIMDLQRASKFIPTQSSNYDGIEAAAKSAGPAQVGERVAAMSLSLDGAGLVHPNGHRALHRRLAGARRAASARP